MTANYYAEIKIVIFQPFWNDDVRMQNVVKSGQIAAKIAHFNSENSEIVGRKFTKFGHDVA